jgi:predicted Rdx family selenoprotein
LDVKPELIKGSGGIFEVAVEGVVVAKKALGQFPDEKAIVDAVSKAIE